MIAARVIAGLALTMLLAVPASAEPASGTVGALVQICADSERNGDDGCFKTFLDWNIFEALDYAGCLPDLDNPGQSWDMYNWLKARPELAGTDAVDGAHEAAMDLYSYC